ncbi:MAG: diadenylate cyclase CdaA [Verrucomicrobiae bacterium]|nr:diadenylate cyclase CdaA [Verrucomicrobiae bacterium]MCP5538946.1 TIGR00159 family protein [Akkermansiaceae bacterium]MCP5550662.1 TIGR00159 family protein [Akkermansiaceae bacterium]
MDRFLQFVADHWRDSLEILLLWAIIYQSYRYFRATRGARIFTGLVGIWIGLTLMSELLSLDVIGWLLKSFSVFLAVALVVIFQPELRRALAELGSHRWFSSFSPEVQREFTEKLSSMVESLSKKRIGALIAIQRGIDLKPYLETGVPLDSRLSSELLQTIFHPGTPLHDGGAVLRIGDERIIGAGCVFPLNQREISDRGVGLRHRAAMGITEESDAIAIVVSEETGAVSLSVEGALERNLDREELSERLNELLHDQGEEEESETDESENATAA